MEIVIESDRLNAPLWYNPMISKDPLFEPELFENGVLAPLDILTTEGKLLTSEEMKLYFKRFPNFLSYYRLKVGLKEYINITAIDKKSYVKPFLPKPDKSYIKVQKRQS